MIKNYIKSAWRNLMRNKLYTLINLIGFSIALASVFILLFYISNEYSYNKGIPNAKQCYRVLSNFKNGSFHTPRAPYPLAEELQRNFPDIEETALFRDNPKLLVKTNQEEITEREFHSVSKEFFKIMGVKIVKGNSRNPLPDAFSIVLNQKMANKYFENGDALGKKLSIKTQKLTRELTVTGIMEDLPENLTYRAEAYLHLDLGMDLLSGNLITYGDQAKQKKLTEDWTFSSIAILLRLSKESNPEILQSKINDHLLGLRGEKYFLEHKLQAMEDVHLHSNHLQNEHQTHGNRKLMLLLLTISMLILIVASINYIVLNTATSLKRTIELGMRRVLGANQASIRKQLLTQSILLSFFCLPLALTLAELITPYLQQIFGIAIKFHYGSNTVLMILFAVLTLMAGILSATYLSVFLSKVEPIVLLKSKKLNHNTHNVIQKGLILVQLIIFIILIISSLLIRQQLNYINVKDLGYEKDALLTVSLRQTKMEGEYIWMKDQLSKSPLISNISGAMSCPPLSFTMQMNIPNPSQPDESIGMLLIFSDENFIQTMGMQMVSGHNISSKKSSNQKGIILNESAVKLMKLQNPIGKNTDLGTVIGVVKDFHTMGLTEAIPPVCIQKVEKANIQSQIKELVIRTRPETLKPTMELIRKVWKKRAPERELQIKMTDERLSRLYREEKKFNRLFQTFTFMAILIAALGLFGFSLFMVEQRTQEIGIRKVMGANILRIIFEFSMEYAKLLLMGFCIASPLAWYFMQRILENYSYRAPIDPWYFALGLFSAAGIVFFSIIGNICKAANRNPVESLKYE